MKLGAALSEQARRVAARSTKHVLLRRGRELEMFVGCGFPKSGTVWLCQLLGTALGVPYPREYRSPIAMSSIIHAHWRFDPRFPPAAYIRRDGRDVMVSLYFYYVRAMALTGKPARARNIRDMFTSIYGPRFDPEAVRDNLPRFVETQMQGPRGSDGLAWHEHVADWWGRPGVSQVAYEDLLSDPVREVGRMTAELGRAIDRGLPRSPSIAGHSPGRRAATPGERTGQASPAKAWQVTGRTISRVRPARRLTRWPAIRWSSSAMPLTATGTPSCDHEQSTPSMRRAIKRFLGSAPGLAMCRAQKSTCPISITTACPPRPTHTRAIAAGGPREPAPARSRDRTPVRGRMSPGECMNGSPVGSTELPSFRREVRVHLSR